MIAAVKGRHAVFAAILFLLPTDAHAADDLGGAARELARKAVSFAGRGESLSATWRNFSSLPGGELNQARIVFENAVRDSGARVVEAGGTVELRITVSENQTQYLLAGEAHKGDERQTLISAWKRPAPNATATGGIALERRLLWEQADPILDVALTPAGMLVLSPGHLKLYERRDAAFEERASVPLTPARPWPRDPRARLSVNGTAVRAFLPGTQCSGTIEPALTLDCRASDEPWTLDAGGRFVLLAVFSSGRNYFDGRIVTQGGTRKTIAPFYSAGAVEDQGRTYWVMSLVDGRTQILDANFEAAGAVAGWGSDLAATSARCGGGSQILATKAGDAREPDSIRAYAVVNRAAAPVTAPMEFGGPVTAMWSAGGASAIVVVRDPDTGRYAASLLTVVCGG
jgi:hypothetical protein